MDTMSAAEVARLLGTSIPRVKRALARISPQYTGAGGRMRITPAQFEQLRRTLGRTPQIEGLSRAEVLSLAALARSPRGLSSARAVARRAGISPTAASGAIHRLIARGLVRSDREWVAAGRAKEVEVLRVAADAPAWAAIASRVSAAELVASDPPTESRVPRRLKHLFWNTAPEQLEVSTSAPYIARRLLTSPDPEGLAWGAHNLPASAWRRAASARGLSSAERVLARNLAKAAHATP